MNQTVHIRDYKHLRGVHCATTALRNTIFYQTNNLISEAMIFGLGSGLNFTYGRFPGSPLWLSMGRGSYIEHNVCDLLGIGIESATFFEPEASWEFVRTQVEMQRLVMLDTDMFHLPYMVQTLGLMEGVHFGGHKVLITGYDLTRRVAYLCDYAWEQPQEVPLDILERARSSSDCPSSPMCRAFLLNTPATLIPLREGVIPALQRTVALMRNPHMHYLGLPALDRFCRQVLNWDRLLGPHADLNAQVTSFMMQKAGTGGGNYRNLQARFLFEVNDLFHDRRLDRAAQAYRTLGQIWRDLSIVLGRAMENLWSGMRNQISSAASLLDNIWRLENQAIDDLGEFVESA